MTCERCHRTDAPALFWTGHHLTQDPAPMYCLECCDAAGIPIPSNLRQASASDTPNDRAEWLAAKAAERRAKLDAFLASRKAEDAPAPKPEPIACNHPECKNPWTGFCKRPAPVNLPAASYKTAAPTEAGQMRLL